MSEDRPSLACRQVLPDGGSHSLVSLGPCRTIVARPTVINRRSERSRARSAPARDDRVDYAERTLRSEPAWSEIDNATSTPRGSTPKRVIGRRSMLFWRDRCAEGVRTTAEPRVPSAGARA